MIWGYYFVFGLHALKAAGAEISSLRYTSIWSNSSTTLADLSATSISPSSSTATSLTSFMQTSSSTTLSPSSSATLASLTLVSSSLSSSSTSVTSSVSSSKYSYSRYQSIVTTSTHVSSSVSNFSVPQSQNVTVANSTEPLECIAHCKNFFPVVTTWAWFTAVESPIVKTVTSYLYVNARTNATSTSFVHDFVSGVNGSERQWQSVWTLTIPRAGTTAYPVLTFPTPYVDYAESYSVIPSPANVDIRIPSGTTCATSDWYSLPSHPPMPQPAAASTPFASVTGKIYGIGSIEMFATASSEFFYNQFPSEGAFKECKSYKRGGVPNGDPPAPTAVHAVQFLTTTVITTTQDDVVTTTPASKVTEDANGAQVNVKSSTTRQDLFGGLATIINRIVSKTSTLAPVATQTPPLVADPTPPIVNRPEGGTTTPSQNHPVELPTGTTTNVSGNSAQVPKLDPVVLPGLNGAIDRPVDPPSQEAPLGRPTGESDRPATFAARIGPDTISVTALPTTDTPAGESKPPLAFAILGTTIAVNQPVLISGTPAAVRESDGGNVLVIGVGPEASTVPMQPAPTPTPVIPPTLITAPIVVDGNTFIPVAGATEAAFSVGGTTLTVGGSVTLGVGSPTTTVFALTTDASGRPVVAFNGQSSTISSPSINAAPSLTLFGTTFDAINPIASSNPSFIISGQTLSLGGTIKIGSGPLVTTLGLTTNSAGQTLLVSNGHTSEVFAASTGSVIPGLLTVNGHTFTRTTLASGVVGYVIAGHTLAQGSSVSFSGTAFTLTTDSAGHTVLVSNGRTSLFSDSILARLLTIDGSIISATTLPSGTGMGYVIKGQTLTLGGSISVSGTILALTTDSRGQTVLVSNGGTSTLSRAGTLATPTASLNVVATESHVSKTLAAGQARPTSQSSTASLAAVFPVYLCWALSSSVILLILGWKGWAIM